MTTRPHLMPVRGRTVRSCGTFLALALMAGAVAASPAAAEEDNFTEQLLTTLGLVAPPPPDIDYRERAPLVVPPSGDALPAPRSADSITQNPAWPKDADIVRREAEKKVTAGPVRPSDKTARRALTPQQVAEGTNANATPSNAQAVARNNALRPNWLATSDMGFLGWGKKTETAVAFTGEPERETLSQPPVGYQTPAPGAAYGVVADREEDKGWRLPSWFDRTQSSNDRR